MRELTNADREEVEVALLFDERDQHLKEVGKPIPQAPFFSRFSVRPGDGRAVAPLFHQGRAEIGLHVLRFHVEALELPADQVREECGDGGIDEAHPKHVSGDRDSEERNGTRKVPENEGEASDCEDGIEEADEEVDGSSSSGRPL